MRKLLAYLFVPVIFSIIGYGLLGAALKPVWGMASAVASFILSDEAPSFNTELTSIYDPEAASKVELVTASAPSEETESAPAAPAEEPYVDIADVDFPITGTQYGLLTNDQLGLYAPVYWDDTNEILRYGAGQFIGSFLPGFGRIILLSAHNVTHFAPLEYIKEGDVVDFSTNYANYQYKVTSVEILNENVLEDRINSMLLEEKETLVMYTCYPFYAISGRKTDRLTVFCDRISGPNVKWRVD